MKKQLKMIAALSAALGWIGDGWSASQQCSLPDQVLSYRVVGDPRSFTPTQLSDVPPGYSVTNGIYQGWCVQYDTFIAAGPIYRGGLYDTHGTLPVHLRNLPWDKINYILNHKRGSAWDVQYVVWHILGQAPNPPSTTPMVEMIADVAQNGAGFVPTNGQIVGVLVESQEGVQRLIIETLWDERCRDTTPPVAAMAAPAPQAVYTEAATVQVAASALDNIGVTRVEFYRDNEFFSSCTTLPYTCSWPINAADNGSYQWSAKVYDYAGNSTVTAPTAVTVSIDVLPPTVSITSPATETRYASAQTVTLTVAAADNFGVTRVELFDRGVLRATLTSPPYSYPWAVTAADNGTHNWVARAHDAAGHSTDSALVSLDVAIDAEPPSVFITDPASGTRYVGAGTVPLTAQAFDNFGVTRVEFFNGGTLVGTRTQAPYTLNWPVTAAINGTHQWTVRAYDAAGHVTQSQVHPLIVDIDIELPSVSIVAPAEGAALSNQLVVVHGTASDNVGILRVEYQVDDGPFAIAQGTTAWQVQLPLTPGPHQIRVRSIDTAGHVSLSAARNIHYYETDSLQVMMTGHGTVTPNLNGHPLELNKTYQLSATPAIGYAFSNWTGHVVGTSPQIQFTMQPNMVVQANFISNPFKPLAGTYNGLFYQETGVNHATCGCFYLTTTARGTFTGYLILEGRRVSFRGQFDAESKATVTIPRRGAAPLVLHLHLYTLDGQDYVQGHVTDGTWMADLLGDRVRIYGRGEQSPFLGRYTLALPATEDVGGHGFGTAMVDRLGGVRLAATLGDGTRLSQRAYVSAGGHWPLYAGLYRNQGSVLGWLMFTNAAQDDLIGQVTWTKPANSRDRMYPAGFTNEISVAGSTFVNTRGQSVLDLPEAVIRFEGGGLEEGFANLIGIDNRNRTVNHSENPLTMSLAAGSGLISGRVTPPVGGRAIAFRGVAHQKRNVAFGQFIGTGVTGSVFLEAGE